MRLKRPFGEENKFRTQASTAPDLCFPLHPICTPRLVVRLIEMDPSKTNPKVDAFLRRTEQWRDEFERLREIILGCGLSEELKWGQPCYTSGGRNIVLIHGFKDYCAVLFIKGALLNDSNRLLIQQTPNVQSARQIRFTHSGEIVQLRPALEAYIHEAVEVEKAGSRVVRKTTAEFSVPDEFREKLEAFAELSTAFYALTPGRQRGYLLYFGSAKQSKTRQARIDKSLPLILEGKGLDD